MSVYQEATKNLLPTPTKSHHLRNISQGIQGICLSRPETADEPSVIKRLWMHEVIFYTTSGKYLTAKVTEMCKYHENISWNIIINEIEISWKYKKALQSSWPLPVRHGISLELPVLPFVVFSHTHSFFVLLIRRSSGLDRSWLVSHLQVVSQSHMKENFHLLLQHLDQDQDGNNLCSLMFCDFHDPKGEDRNCREVRNLDHLRQVVESHLEEFNNINKAAKWPRLPVVVGVGAGAAVGLWLGWLPTWLRQSFSRWKSPRPTELLNGTMAWWKELWLCRLRDGWMVDKYLIGQILLIWIYTVSCWYKQKMFKWVLFYKVST